MSKEDVLEMASMIVTWKAAYSCYPEDLEEYYKKGMSADQLADVFINELRKNGFC